MFFHSLVRASQPSTFLLGEVDVMRVSAKQKLLVIQSQDTVTIPIGGVPVIAAVDVVDARDVVMAVNFLRCGCEAVQIVAARWCTEEERWFTGEELVRDILRLLQLPGEEFSVSHVPCEDNVEKGVFTVRRELI